MPSPLDRLADSTHRAVLGGLLAVVAILGAGVARTALPAGDYLLGVPGALVAIGASLWILALFVEGIRER